MLRQSSYSKQQSLSKIQPQNQYQNLNKGSIMGGPSDYNVVSASERGSYNHSQITAINPNVAAINSHRKIGNEGGKHMRHNSDQVPHSFVAQHNPLLNQKGHVQGAGNHHHHNIGLLQSQQQQQMVAPGGVTSKQSQVHANVPKQSKAAELKPLAQHASGSEMIIMD